MKKTYDILEKIAKGMSIIKTKRKGIKSIAKKIENDYKK